MQEISKNSVVVIYVDIGSLPANKAKEKMNAVKSEMESQFSPAKVVVLSSNDRVEVFNREESLSTDKWNKDYQPEYFQSEYTKDVAEFKPVDLKEPPLRVDNSFLDEFAGEPMVTEHSLTKDLNEWKQIQLDTIRINEELGQYDENYKIIYDIDDFISKDLVYMTTAIAMKDGFTFFAVDYDYDITANLQRALQNFEYLYEIVILKDILRIRGRLRQTSE